jgi:hypothetical protein
MVEEAFEHIRLARGSIRRNCSGNKRYPLLAGEVAGPPLGLICDAEIRARPRPRIIFYPRINPGTIPSERDSKELLLDTELTQDLPTYRTNPQAHHSIPPYSRHSWYLKIEYTLRIYTLTR